MPCVCGTQGKHKGQKRQPWSEGNRKRPLPDAAGQTRKGAWRTAETKSNHNSAPACDKQAGADV